MNTPEWLKLGIYSALIGAVFVGVAGFSWSGWMTGGGAVKMASAMAQYDVIAARVPICIDMSRNDDERIAELAMIRAATSNKRRGAVVAATPGSDLPSRDIALACVDGLNLDAS